MQLERRDQFPMLLNKLGLNGYAIELGVLAGDFSEWVLMNSMLRKYYCVDIWAPVKDSYKDRCNVDQEEQDERMQIVVDRMKKYGERAEIIKGDCNKIVNDFDNNFFDFVYLDADHSYEFVKKNLEDWWPKVKQRGILAGHDYVNGFLNNTDFGVKSAVDEFVKKENLDLFVTTNEPPARVDVNDKKELVSFNSWYFRKGKQLSKKPINGLIGTMNV